MAKNMQPIVKRCRELNISPSVMGYILGSLLTKRFGGYVYSDEIGLPVEACGMCLPCGSTAVWCAEKQEGVFYGRNG